MNDDGSIDVHKKYQAQHSIIFLMILIISLVSSTFFPKQFSYALSFYSEQILSFENLSEISHAHVRTQKRENYSEQIMFFSVRSLSSFYFDAYYVH